jgi:hypothetical protein
VTHASLNSMHSLTPSPRAACRQAAEAVATCQGGPNLLAPQCIGYPDSPVGYAVNAECAVAWAPVTGVPQATLQALSKSARAYNDGCKLATTTVRSVFLCLCTLQTCLRA